MNMSSFINGYSFIRDVNKCHLAVKVPAIRTELVPMRCELKARHCCSDVRYLGEGNKLPWLELPHANIITTVPIR